MTSFGFEILLMCTHFEGQSESEKVYILYIYENVDIFGWHLKSHKNTV